MDRLQVACVMAVHTEYEDNRHYQAAVNELIDTRIVLPGLSTRSELAKVVTHRARRVTGDRSVNANDVLEHDALSTVFDHYRVSHSLRGQMIVLNGALVRACDDDAVIVGNDHVVAAIAG